MLYSLAWNLRVSEDVLVVRRLWGQRVVIARQAVKYARFDIHLLGIVSTRGRFKVSYLSRHYPHVLRFVLDMPSIPCKGNLWLHEFYYRFYWWAIPRRTYAEVLSMLKELRQRQAKR